MLYYNRIDLSEGIDVAKIITVKTVWFVTIRFLTVGLNFKILSVKVAMIWGFFCVNLSDIDIMTVTNLDYLCICS